MKTMGTRCADSEEVDQKVFWCLVSRRCNIRGGLKMTTLKSKNGNIVNEPQKPAHEHFEA